VSHDESDDFEQNLRALVDGQTATDTGSPSAGAEHDALRALHAIARGYRLALFGTDVSPDRPAGHVWGHLEIRAEIGRGANGTVYRAWDPRLAREVALKLIDPAVADPARALEEGRRLARLRHPHIVRVFGADQIDGVTGIWMELLEGDTLEEGLSRDGIMSAEEALLAGIDIARALSSVHAAGLIHGDVTARNVFRERGGRLVLMDLGASRPASHTAAEAGAPLYMAPELLGGAASSPRSDVYALGVLIFRLLSGEGPVQASTLTDLRDAHARGQRAGLQQLRPGLAAPVVSAVERAVAPVPADRYANAIECEAALRDALHVEIRRRHAVRAAPVRTLIRRRVWAAAGAILAAAIGVAAVLGWNTVPARSLRRHFGLPVPPRSPLYLTVSGGLVILRDGRPEVRTGNTEGAVTLAVSTSTGVDTLAAFPPSTVGGRYSLAGDPLVPAPSFIDGWCCSFDGTTDGRFNYVARKDSTLLEPAESRQVAPPAVYRFERDWTRPRVAFPLEPDGEYVGIAYAGRSHTFLVARNVNGRGLIEEWSEDGHRLRVLVDVMGTSWAGVAVDPADGTLWAVEDSFLGSGAHLDNFDADGRSLGDFKWQWPALQLRLFGAEFAWRDGS